MTTTHEDFEARVGPFRGELQAHCYRMTGSLVEAEDLVQESLLRAWRGLKSFQERSSLRTWLYKVTTNTCLNALASRRVERAMPASYDAPARRSSNAAYEEPLWLDPCPESLYQATPPHPEALISTRQSVALAFMVALQRLSARERAVLVLRDVIGMSATETADALEVSVAAANSALQRAREKLKSVPGGHDTTSGASAVSGQRQALLERYKGAWESGDVDALVALLTDDAVLTMPPAPSWFQGRSDCASFLEMIVTTQGRFRVQLLVASGAPAVAVWRQAPGEALYRPNAIHVLDVDEHGVRRVDAFINSDLFPHFALSSEAIA